MFSNVCRYSNVCNSVCNNVCSRARALTRINLPFFLGPLSSPNRCHVAPPHPPLPPPPAPLERAKQTLTTFSLAVVVQRLVHPLLALLRACQGERARASECEREDTQAHTCVFVCVCGGGGARHKISLRTATPAAAQRVTASCGGPRSQTGLAGEGGNGGNGLLHTLHGPHSRRLEQRALLLHGGRTRSYFV